MGMHSQTMADNGCTCFYFMQETFAAVLDDIFLYVSVDLWFNLFCIASALRDGFDILFSSVSFLHIVYLFA